MTITKTIDTQQIKQHIDLRELARLYTELHGTGKELYGPCPKCGGDDRFHVKADWWFCRDCYPHDNGLSHDTIAFAMWLNGLDFKAAAAWLTNAPMPTKPLLKRTPSPKIQAAQTLANQRKFAAIAKTANKRLFNDNDKEAEAGRSYLEVERKILPQSWLAFGLGFKPDVLLPGTKRGQVAPAIVIPWVRGGQVCALRYRFLQHHKYIEPDGNKIDAKQTSEYGSVFAGVFFGGQVIGTNVPSRSTVIVCEGEMNDISIWQESPGMRLDVLSIGSESAQITPAMAAHIKKYELAIPWADKPEVAQKLMGILSLTKGISSKAGDANDLLCAGILGSFLAYHRFEKAENRQQQESLLLDLMAAAKTPMGLDSLTSDVMNQIESALNVDTSIL